jgi:hypothetical protein
VKREPYTRVEPGRGTPRPRSPSEPSVEAPRQTGPRLGRSKDAPKPLGGLLPAFVRALAKWVKD